MECPRCQTPNVSDSTQCEACGASLLRPCGACGHLNPPGSRFCNACGGPLATGSSRPVPKHLASPRAYTPPELATKILISRSALEGERKTVTVLFCDIVGSTLLAQRLGAEQMHALLDQFFGLAMTEVHRYEGTINQFLGDGFMALFGAPVAHEDHALRAARAALAIRNALDQARIAPERTGERIRVRMGMNTGPVVVGKIGDNLRMDYTAVGDTTNLAARVTQSAHPDEIYLTEQVFEALRPQFVCESLGDHRVKGKSHRLPVYALKGLRTDRIEEHRPKGGVLSPLVGRDRERSLLSACVDALRSGVGAVVGILGEAGVGKSRLLSELRLAKPPGLLWIETRALSVGRGIAYGPWIEIVRALAGTSERATPAENWERLSRWVTELLGTEAAGALPFIGVMVGVDTPADVASHVQQLDSQDVRGNLFISIRRLFAALARSQPLVLEFEDWHWADDASAGLLEHLLPLTGEVPLLICFAGRTDPGSACIRIRDAASNQYAPRYTEVLLGTLSSSDSNRLIDNLIPVSGLPAHLRGLILRKSEGNPLFIEEVVRSLIASGAVRREAATGAWFLVEDMAEIGVPDTIEGVIMARIDRLEDDIKQVLKLAAVIGRSFHRRILQALDEAEHQLEGCLAQLQQLELIREKQQVPEVEYAFKHALVQEVSYQSVLAERRRRLHKRIGDTIAELFGDRVEEFAGYLAYHYSRAEDWKKAHRYLLLAGDQSARMAADVEATVHYREALAAYGRVFGDRWDPVQRAALERKIGEALFRLGQHAEAAEHLQRALSYLGAGYPRSAAGVRLGIVRNVLQQAWHQARGAHSGKENAPVSAAEDERMQAHVSLAWIDYFGDSERCLLGVLSGLNWSERIGMASGIAEGSMGVGVICNLLGLFRVAHYYLSRAMDTAQRTQDSRAVALAVFGQGLHQIFLGRWDTAAAQLEQAAAMWKSLGALREWGIATVTAAWVRRLLGQLQSCLSALDEVARLGRDAGDVQLITWAAQLQAAVNGLVGHLDTSIATLENGVRVLMEIPDYHITVEAMGQLAGCYLRRGGLSRAAATLDECDRVILKTRLRGYNLASPLLARAWTTLAYVEQCRPDQKAKMLASARRASKSARRLGRLFIGAEPQALCTQGSIAWLEGHKQEAHRYWMRSGAVAEQLGARHDAALTYRELGRHSGDKAQLQRAAQVFEEIGAQFELAQTYRYLGELGISRREKESSEWFERAIALHGALSANYELSLTCAGFGRLCKSLGRSSDAQAHLARAIALLPGDTHAALKERITADLAAL